jgi:hypothetical protein
MQDETADCLVLVLADLVPYSLCNSKQIVKNEKIHNVRLINVVISAKKNIIQ